MNWMHFNIAFAAMICVFVVGIPIGLLLRDIGRMIQERRQNRRWLNHCKHCLYFRRIQFTTLDNYHQRGVVCDNGIDFEYVKDPMKCERFKPRPCDD